MQKADIARACHQRLLEHGMPLAVKPQRDPVQVDGFDWYVLKTEFQREKIAAHALGELGLRAYVPMVTVRIFRRQPFRGVDVERALFPTYTFAGMRRGQERFYDTRKAKGVVGILGAQGTPQRISGRVVADIDAAVLAGLLCRPIEINLFAKGEQVRVADGPFISFNGIVEDALPNETYKVLLSLFGRATPVTLEACQIEKV